MTKKIEIVDANMGHIEQMAPFVRQEDADEIWAAAGLTVEGGLVKSLRSSFIAKAAFVDGKIACMFGVSDSGATMLGGVGVPWLIGTRLIDENRREFLIRSRAWIEDMRELFPVLRNHVDARYRQAIRWLRWLGFSMHEAEPFGPEEMPFHLFVMRRPAAVVVRKCRVSDITGNIGFPSLRAEFAKEVATTIAPAALDKLDTYAAIETTGAVQAFAAFLGDMVVGFVVVLTPDVPRCSQIVAVADGLFVGKLYRNTGAGAKLIKAAERHALDRGSPCLMIGTPSNGPLAVILPRTGYRETNRVFMKELRHG